MKKTLAILLVLCMILTCIPQEVQAATSGSCGNNVNFTFNENTGLLKIYGSGDMWDFQYNYGYSSAPWWEYVANIKKVEIGSGVTRIGNTAFNGCWNAESITIPATVTSIGSKAFYGCTALTSITIPSGVTTIESYTFYRTGITEIDLPDGITSLGIGAFADSSLTSIDIPAGVTTISENLFNACDNLETVIIRGDITNIGEKAFYNTALKELVFEGSLSGTIGEHAFAYCENLPSFHVPGTVTEIEGYAFCGCEGLTELTLEEGITDIGESAFRETGISTLTIPSTVSYFGGRIADFADNLKNVTMYTQTVEICKTWILSMRDLDYVHIIGDAPKTTVKVFSSTSQASDFVVYYDEGTSGWEGDTWNGYKIMKWGQTEPIASGTCGDNLTWSLDEEGTLTISGTGDMENYVIQKDVPWYSHRNQIIRVRVQEGVTSLCDYAFYGHTNMIDITLPESLVRIGDVALGETALEYVNIPAGVTEIGSDVFHGCTKLNFIDVSENNTMFSNDDSGVLFNKDKTQLLRCPQAFEGAYVIPGTVELVAEKAFERCMGITEVTVPGSVKELSRHAFVMCFGLETVHLNEGLEVIGVEAFMNCMSLTGSLTIPTSVKKVGDAAFDMTGLQEIRFTGDMPEIGEYTFSAIDVTVYYPASNSTWTEEKIEAIKGISTFVPYDTQEEELSGTWGDNITWVLSKDGTLTVSGQGQVKSAWGDEYPWYAYAQQIRHVVFEEGVTNVPEMAFNYNYPNLVSVVLKSVETIGYSAFSQCYALSTVTLPDTLKEIGNGAFDYTSITAIDLPNSLTTLGNSVFGNTPLTSIVLPEGLETMGSDVFMFCTSLKSVVLPDSLTSWRRLTFGYCSALESINIPAGVSDIPSSMFSGCTSLKSIEIPGNITSILSSAFYGTGLEEITFQGDAPEIYDTAFDGVTATAYYPANNAAWTADKRQNYGGTITWVPVVPECTEHAYEAVVTAPTCQSQGYTTHTCSVCGDNYIDSYVDPIDHSYDKNKTSCEWCGLEALANFTSYTCSLGGNISVNFYVNVTEELLNNPDAYVLYQYAGLTVKQPISAGQHQSGSEYKFSCPVNSKQMTVPITAQFFVGDTPVSRVLTKSVADYANYLVQNSKSEKVVNLMTAMLNYGAASQTYFKYRTDELANSQLSAEAKELGTVDATAFAHQKIGELQGIKLTGATLMLDSETTIRIYFQPEEGKSIEDFTFTVNGQKATPTLYKGEYYISMPNIGAHNLDEMYVFTCNDFEVHYSGRSYVNQLLKSYHSGPEYDLARALYRYSEAAENYLAN